MPGISLEIRRKCKICGKVFLVKKLESQYKYGTQKIEEFIGIDKYHQPPENDKSVQLIDSQGFGFR